MAQTAADVPVHSVRAITPGKKEKAALDPVEVQQNLLRFADEFTTRVTLGVDRLRRGTSALDPGEALRLKIALGTATCAVASGPNPVANLLDMTIFVTVTRMALEEQWQPNVYGESGRPILESLRNAETNIWHLVGKVIKPDQQRELLAAAQTWRRQNPLPEDVLAARALNITSQVAESRGSDMTTPGSVFSLLKVDPLAGIDPAMREIAQTRLFAERALYVTQKMPMLLRWQTELLSVNAVQLPAVKQLITNSTQISTSVERFAAVAEQLPAQFSTERAAVLKALEEQEKTLTPLVNEVRQTITSGTGLSTSLNTTLMTTDALMKRFGVGETNNTAPPKTNAEPFRIQDYGQAAEKFEATARQLTELLHTLDQTTSSNNLSRLSAQVAPLMHEAKSSGKEVVEYAFWRGLTLVGTWLAAALIYRFVGTRLSRVTGLKSP